MKKIMGSKCFRDRESTSSWAFTAVGDLNTNALDKTLDGMKDFSDKISGFISQIFENLPFILGVDVYWTGKQTLFFMRQKQLRVLD